MGAGAFVMVELTGTPYTDIMAAAMLPALLYFATVWMASTPMPRAMTFARWRTRTGLPCARCG